MARQFTRAAFHELVWSRPMTQLAKEFALSDVALHKICRRHDIPTPPVGWWARHAAGKAVSRTPLPRAEDDATAIVIAAADLTSTDVALTEAREQARILASSGVLRSSAAMHPAIGRTLAALRKDRPSSQGLIVARGPDVIRCTVGSASVGRLSDILPSILAAAAVQGFDLEPAEGGCRFRSSTETLGFEITEALDRSPHEMTEAEKVADAAWKKKRDDPRRRDPWSFLENRPAVPEWDYAPGGRLAVEFERVWVQARTSPRRSFRDGRTQTLETMTADIAVGLAVLAAAKTKKRLEQEVRERAWREEQARREEAAKAAWIEERRRDILGTILEDVESAERLRRLVAGLRAGRENEPGERVEAFLTWAVAEMDRRSAALSGAELEAMFASRGLFGADEGQGFRSGRWS